MSDMEQEWKGNGRRPQSIMAQAFSSALDNAFSLDSEVEHLAQTIDQKKQMMLIQSRELEILQAKIREAEDRLKARQSMTVDTSKLDFQTDHNEESEHAVSRSTGEQNHNNIAHPVETSSRSDSRPSAQGSFDLPTSRGASHVRHKDHSHEDLSSDEQTQGNHYQQEEASPA